MSGADPECQVKGGRGVHAPFQDRKGLDFKPYVFQYRPTTTFSAYLYCDKNNVGGGVCVCMCV